MRSRAEIAAFLFSSVVLACDGAPAPTDAGPADVGLPDTGPDAGPRCTPASLPAPLVCNGRAELCDRTYDAVAFPMAHNAMSSEEEDWLAPNQGRNLWHQLEDGVRGFMLDTYESGGVTMLCHSTCNRTFGMRPLGDALADLREFMTCHPAEVISIVFEAHVDEATMAAAFEGSGLEPMRHEQPLGAPWPSLRSMIESGRRLVIFTESSAATLPWYHYAYAYMWDNPYAARMTSDFDCSVGRGVRANGLFLLNHFLTAPVAMRSLAEMANPEAVLGAHADRCVAETGDFPNFVAVDFYDVGDLFAVVDRLNGF
jgi:hypothetical protein